jgi:flagellar biosynthesis regulator FlbT
MIEIGLFDLLKAGTALAGAVKAWLPKREEQDCRLQDELSFALRQLYFAPDGVISLLKDVVADREISETRLRQALGDFNDRQWKVQEALQRIDFHQLRRKLGVSLLTMRVLSELQYGKASLRREIQSEVNRYGQQGAIPKKSKVRRLIGSIEDLNAAIEDIEAIINARARSPDSSKRPLPQKSGRKRKARSKKAMTS